MRGEWGRLLISLLFVIGSTAPAFTQADTIQPYFDGLPNDTTKVLRLVETSRDYRFINRTIAYDLLVEARDLGREIGFERGYADAIYWLGRITYMQSDYEQSKALYEEALAIYEKLDNETGRAGMANCYMSIGDVNYSIDNFPAAEEQIRKALKIYESLNSEIGIANCYLTLGDIFYSMDDYAHATENYQLSFTYYQKAGSDLGMANAINTMADITFEQGAYTDAIPQYAKAIDMFVEVGDTIGLANCTKRLGDIEWELKKYDSAKRTFQRAFNYYQAVGSRTGMGNSLRSLGEVWMIEGKMDSAFAAFDSTMNIFQRSQDVLGIANTELTMARAFVLQEQFDSASASNLRAYEIASQLGSLELQMVVCGQLAEVYEKMDSAELALYYHKRFKFWSDSLRNAENIRQVTQMQMNFAFDQEKKESELAHALELERADLLRNFLIFAVLAILLVAILAYISFRNKKKAAAELTLKNEIIEQKNRDITASIEYARRIQEAILTSPEEMQAIFGQHFIFFRPRDIVSGDFYWAYQFSDGSAILAVADCTGHGVPGAFMSMIGSAYLDEIVIDHGERSPARILDKIREQVIRAMGQGPHENIPRDGMDMALIHLDANRTQATFAGANSFLYHVSEGKLMAHKGNHQPASWYYGEMKPFEEWQLPLKNNDMLYMFSDGFADQFGGVKGKKFMYRNFRQILTEIAPLPVAEQRSRLESTMDNWQGDQEQVDDMVVTGVRISQ